MGHVEIITNDYYSNCLIEAIKAKFKNPKNIKITICLPWFNEVFCPHFMWTDGLFDYDFGIEEWMPMIAAYTIHKGHIRKREKGFIEKYQRAMKKRFYRNRRNFLKKVRSKFYGNT